MLYEIIKYPEPVLEKVADPVTRFDNELAKLVDDMFESMYAAEGIGLAAPQINISKRLTVIDTSFKKNPDDKVVLINPEIVAREGSQYEEEGCLSLPDVRDKVKRAAWIKVRAQNVKGGFFEIEGTELLARAFQHEIDHLDGILFFQHLSRLKKDLTMRSIRKRIKNGDW